MGGWVERSGTQRLASSVVNEQLCSRQGRRGSWGEGSRGGGRFDKEGQCRSEAEEKNYNAAGILIYFLLTLTSADLQRAGGRKGEPKHSGWDGGTRGVRGCVTMYDSTKRGCEGTAGAWQHYQRPGRQAH